VSTPSPADRLAQRRHVAVVLRLVVDARGHLVQGELVDLEAGPWTRFVGWRGLSRALHGWLANQAASRVPRSPSEGP